MHKSCATIINEPVINSGAHNGQKWFLPCPVQKSICTSVQLQNLGTGRYKFDAALKILKMLGIINNEAVAALAQGKTMPL